MEENRAVDEKRNTLDEISLGENETVQSAVHRRDWSCLRSLSLKPGGFGTDRRYAW